MTTPYLRLTSVSFALAMTCALSISACGDDGDGDTDGMETTGGDGDGDMTGDGDGDPATGDGDGDMTGDGDGDMTGDGDGDMTGDGDGDMTGDGDGDGDMTGDGDGDMGLSFEADVFPIINASCSCHVNGAPGGLEMPDAATAYANLVDVSAGQAPDLSRVEPGAPADSYMLQKIMGTQDGISPANAQMPKSPGEAMSANPLSDADQTLISDWIADGAAL